MAASVSFSAVLLLAGLFAGITAVAQKRDAPVPEESRLRLNKALLQLD